MERVKFLVEDQGVSLEEAKDPWDFGQTVLHWAAKGGSAKLIKYLAEKGADVRAVDEVRPWPFSSDCPVGKYSIVRHMRIELTDR